MEAEPNSAGPSGNWLRPESRPGGQLTNAARFPAPRVMESRLAPPPFGDGRYPGAGTLWGGTFPSGRLPSPAQYALSNSKGGAYTTEPPGRRPPSPEATPSPVLTPTYCSGCKKMFATREAFARHEPMHALSAKLFPCLECGKYYRHNTALVIHRRTHTGEKPYGCGVCGRRFNARSSLVTHGKIHAANKACPPCPECGKTFASPDDLLRHRQLCRSRGYACDDCGKRFRAEAELAAHRLIHPTEELYLCSGCGRDFTQYSKLLRHQKSHPQPPPVFISGERMLGGQ